MNETGSPLDSSAFPNWLVIILIVLASVICVVTIVANAVVLLAFVIDHNIRKPQYYFLGSLALSDLTIGFVSMPLFLQYMYLNAWLLPQEVCITWLIADFSACTAARMIVVLITTDRYLSLKFPWTYRAYQTKKNYVVATAVVWAVCLAVFSISIAGWPYFVDIGKTMLEGSCHVLFMDDVIFTTMYAVGCFWIPLVYVCVLYRKIYLIALSVHKASSGSLLRSALKSRMTWQGSAGARKISPSKKWGTNRIMPTPQRGVATIDVIEDVSDPDPDTFTASKQDPFTVSNQDIGTVGRQDKLTSKKQEAGSVGKQNTSASNKQEGCGVGHQDMCTVRKQNTWCISCREPSLITDVTATDKDTTNEKSQMMESTHSLDVDYDSESEGDKEDDESSLIMEHQAVSSPTTGVTVDSVNKSDSYVPVIEKSNTSYGDSFTNGTVKTGDDEDIRDIKSKTSHGDSIVNEHDSTRNETDDDVNENAKTINDDDCDDGNDYYDDYYYDDDGELSNDSKRNEIGGDVNVSAKTAQQDKPTGGSNKYLQPDMALARLSISSNITEDMTYHTSDSLDEYTQSLLDLSEEMTEVCPEMETESEPETKTRRRFSVFNTVALKPLQSAFSSRSTMDAWQRRIGSIRWTSGFMTSRRKKRQMYHSHVRKALRIITLILALFICSWTPYFVLVMINVIAGDPAYVNHTLYTICYCLCYLNSTFNPICYAFANIEFRRIFMRIIKCNWRVM